MSRVLCHSIRLRVAELAESSRMDESLCDFRYGFAIGVTLTGLTVNLHLKAPMLPVPADDGAPPSPQVASDLLELVRQVVRHVEHQRQRRLGVASPDRVAPFVHVRVLRPPVKQPSLDLGLDRKSTRLNSSHRSLSRMPSSA